MLMLLFYYEFLAILEGFNDANCISDTQDTTSTSAYVFTLGGGWCISELVEQTCSTSYTMETELTALHLVGLEEEWLRNLYADMPM